MMSEYITMIENMDVSDLRQISETTFYDTFEGEYSDDDFNQFFKESYNEKVLLNELNNPNSFHYFYKMNDQIAGYLKLNVGNAQTEPKGEDYLEIQRIYFYKTYQGGGRGQKFIQLALDKAKELNKNKVWLGVWEHNQRALHFYSKMGFHHIGQHAFFMGDDEQIDLIYYKDI